MTIMFVNLPARATYRHQRQQLRLQLLRLLQLQLRQRLQRLRDHLMSFSYIIISQTCKNLALKDISKQNLVNTG